MTIAGKLQEIFDYLCPFCNAPYSTIEEDGKSKFVHKGVTNTKVKVALPTSGCVPYHDYVIFQPCRHCCPDVFDRCRACKLGYPGTISRISLPTQEECHCHYCYEEIATIETREETQRRLKTDTAAESRPAQPMLSALKIFISYSHKDEDFKDELITMVGGLQRRGIIDAWQDRRIDAGAEWLREITRAMAECKVALLLISPDFLNSRFIQEEELRRIFERRVNEGLRAIPIILRPCLWKSEPILKDLQALPRDGKAVITFSRDNGDRDQVWSEIGTTIERLAVSIRQ